MSDRDYKSVITLFEAAHAGKALSELGEDVYQRLLKVWEEAEGHGGDLTPLGVRQHRGIAERMYAAFPEAFKGEAFVSARSTVVFRCAMSMVAFGDRLKELNPNLRISYESSRKYMNYMNYHSYESNLFTSSSDGPWTEEYKKFEAAHTKPDRLVASLFKDERFILKKVNPKELMWGLYWIASECRTWRRSSPSTTCSSRKTCSTCGSAPTKLLRAQRQPCRQQRAGSGQCETAAAQHTGQR